MGNVLVDDRTAIMLQISIGVPDLAPQRLACLAQELKQRYRDRSEIDVLIFSDNDAAKKWIVSGKHARPERLNWNSNLHGYYTYDRAMQEERIEISPDPLQSQIDSPTETIINLPITGTPQCKIQLDARCLLVLPSIWPFRGESDENKESGSVALAGEVAPNGGVGGIRVVESSLNPGEDGDFLKKVAIQNLQAWRFEAVSHADAIRTTYEFRNTPPRPGKRSYHVEVQMEQPDKSVTQINLSILVP
ncbi:MAG: hypothetical protein WAO35_03485 [Terriglobia bacterium]